MNRSFWLVVVLLISVILWFSVIIWAPVISLLFLSGSGLCPSASIVECKEVLSALGATGDIFGMVTSLFSGLTLFAVAFTLWMDVNARRDSRKPLVVTYLDQDSLILREPVPGKPPRLTLTLNAKVANKTGDAALNVWVKSEFFVANERLFEAEMWLKQPLMSSGTEDVSCDICVDGDDLLAALSDLTAAKSMKLQLTTSYSSLEKVKWTTKVEYLLDCSKGDDLKRLNSLKSDTDDFGQLWANGANVGLDVTVVNGTWEHSGASK